jgi:hypothetical protein
MEGIKKEKFKVKEKVCKEIVSVINAGLGELEAEERKKLLIKLDSVMWKWMKCELEYWEAFADEDAEWDDYGCMKFVLEDFCKVWYDSIASDLGMESYDEKEKREYEEFVIANREAEIDKYNRELEADEHWANASEKEKREYFERMDVPSEEVVVKKEGDDDLPF